MTDTPAFREVTDLAAQTPLAKSLIHAAFAERLGAVELDLTFHRNWNGGWRCRALLAGRVLEFVLLTNDRDVLLAFPVPMPRGWLVRGVAASDGSRWTAADDGDVVAVTE